MIEIPIAVALPDGERDRQRLREALDPMPLPAKYVNGAVTLPCSECLMPLNVGPRINARIEEDGVKLVCPWCMGKFATEGSRIENMGNPDSKWEGQQ